MLSRTCNAMVPDAAGPAGPDALQVVADDSALRRFVAAAVEGDDRALDAFVTHTHRSVHSLCVRLGSAGEVDDLVQETYLRAVKSLESYRGESPVLPWLLTIARRTCADHVRRRQRERRILERVVAESPQVVTTAEDYTDDLVDALDFDRREAFVLTQIVGLPYSEAAKIIGCPIGTIRSRVARARSDLQSMLSSSNSTEAGEWVS